jgi:hypothetical protein
MVDAGYPVAYTYTQRGFPGGEPFLYDGVSKVAGRSFFQANKGMGDRREGGDIRERERGKHLFEMG